MKITLLAVGNKMPGWISEGFNEYQKRMPAHLKPVLQEIEPAKRTSKALEAKAKETEAKAILAAIPKRAYVIALDERGKQYSSFELSEKLHALENKGEDTVIIIGGPEGLTDEVRERADEMWSLSKLTLPHPLVRVVLAETLYRAYSIGAGLPYHRA